MDVVIMENGENIGVGGGYKCGVEFRFGDK